MFRAPAVRPLRAVDLGLPTDTLLAACFASDPRAHEEPELPVHWDPAAAAEGSSYWSREGEHRPSDLPPGLDGDHHPSRPVWNRLPGPRGRVAARRGERCLLQSGGHFKRRVQGFCGTHGLRHQALGNNEFIAFLVILHVWPSASKHISAPQLTDDDLVYTNLLIYSPEASPDGLIRMEEAVIPIECHYERSVPQRLLKPPCATCFYKLLIFRFAGSTVCPAPLSYLPGSPSPPHKLQWKPWTSTWGSWPVGFI